MSEGGDKVLLLVLRRTDEELDSLSVTIRRLIAEVPARARLKASAYFRTSTGAAAILLEAAAEGFDPDATLAAVPGLGADRLVRPLVTPSGPARAMLSGFDIHLGDRLDPIDALKVIQEAAQGDGTGVRERRRARRFPGPGDLVATLTVEGAPHRGKVSNIALSGCFVELGGAFPPIGSIANVVLQGLGPEVRLTARVVFRLGREQAEGLGRLDGVGLKFLSLAAHGRERLLRLVEAAATGAGLEGKDRRTERRLPIRLRVALQGPQEIEHLLTQNLSSGGLFLKTHHPPPVGSHVALELRLPETELPLGLEGEVRHHDQQEDGTTGVGIAFESLDDETIATLENYLQKLSLRHRLRILLVDDTRFFRTVVGDALREGGYEVIEAETGTEALKIISEEILTLDLLILDLELPEMKGAEVLDRLRSVGGEADLPVLLLSGKVGFDVGAGIASRRRATFLPKETPMPEILLAVEKLLSADPG
ncbi:MAG: TIGR02266 family protein [Deltaproteobacteria bacterium]|nr:TIGR02266 family protein [Deltaproteobacteria bacterium]